MTKEIHLSLFLSDLYSYSNSFCVGILDIKFLIIILSKKYRQCSKFVEL